jgi:hypothetical protein
MIFVSHNHKDKFIVENFAISLSNIFGQDKVFYDSWSIQPGDGILDKMNAGLTTCEFFLFFVSENSLKSKMVQLEWQNALMKSTIKGIKFIPIRIDNSDMPVLLMQSLYIDIYGAGVDAATRQIIDVISRKNTYSPQAKFSNLRASGILKDNEFNLTVEATKFMEPITSFLLVFDNEITDFEFDIPGDNSYQSSDICPVELGGGKFGSGKALGLHRPMTPGHPFHVSIVLPEEIEFNFVKVMHEISKAQWVEVPFDLKIISSQ